MYLRLEMKDSYDVASPATEHQMCFRPAGRHGKGADVITNLKLFPGVAIVYASNLRYQNVPPDAITVDMFDATPFNSGEVEKRSGVPKLNHRPSGRPFETRSYADGVLPRTLSKKMAALHVVGASMDVTPTTHIVVPGVGVAFGTGVSWVNVTEEDCRDAQQEIEEREAHAAAAEVDHGS